MSDSPPRGVEAADPEFSMPSAPAEQPNPSAASAKGTFQSAKDSPMRQAPANTTANVDPTPSSAIQQPSSPFATRTRLPVMSPRSPSPRKMGSPAVHSPQKPSPQKLPSSSPQKGFPKPTENFKDTSDGHGDEAGIDHDVRSPSDASSPIRPIVRKSSLNFASLPAREPLGSKKSLGGARMSRTSHLDFSRQSYYNRHTGGKSLGHITRPDPADEDDDDDDEMDVDDELILEKDATAEHTKTYTQRLQDQINMLGKAQPTSHRPSKSIANLLPSQQSASATQSQSQMDPTLDIKRLTSPKPKSKQSVAAPGAFPSDDDDWIAPPAKAVASSSPQARPSKEHSEKAEGLAGKETAESHEFVFPKGRLGSPGKASPSPRRTAGTPSHTKSASVPSFPTIDQLSSDPDDVALKKTISVSNPALSTVAEDDFASPPRSPTRTFRDNPLKQVKNKLSSLLKSSKGLIASSAAISAEGKSSLLQSPSTSRLGYHPGPSVESFTTADNVVYPDLSQQISATSAPLSPTRSNSSRRTRASAERERREAKERDKEDKEKEKELKEAKRMAEQMDKLEKLREQEREKARFFSKEQEKIAAMERQVAVQKEQETTAQAQSQPQAHDFRTPGPLPKRTPRSPPKTTGTTPGKTKGQAEEEGKNTAALSDELDFEMQDATSTIAPPSIPRPTTASSVRTQGKRPIKPTKEASVKAKQAPTVIRVNTTSSQHSQFHPSNSVLAATLQETLGQQPSASQRQVNSKASQASLHTKPSLQSLKSSVSSASRPKALEAAAKRKEQEEREAQRKRDAKRELERKRAAQEEERRAERQREEERKAAQAKKAAIEKAKQTKAPPPAVRSQPNGPPDYSIADKGPMRPPSRLGSTMHQDGRPVNAVLSNNGKRPLQHDPHEEGSRSQQQRALPSFPSKEGKRMRMSEEFDEDIDMVDSQRIIKPPVRPSGGFKKVSRQCKWPLHKILTLQRRICPPSPCMATATATPTLRPAQPGISSRQQSRRNTTARPRLPIRSTWLSCPRAPFRLRRTPTQPARPTRLLAGRREAPCPSRPSRSRGHRRASRTGSQSSYPISRPTTRATRRTHTFAWRPGRSLQRSRRRY